ncbi:5-methylcytosine restriction system specificity protein McrC [Paenibacillus phytohabitans]|uniref:5-methylcytosine restriction system specificity protein McrC n=1 Tax=Paenibacillus phytohabitans TaxID=2654978 RepID=UPI003008AE90
MYTGTDVINLESQYVINVNTEEYEFFDKFLESKNIPWRKENRELGILPLSRSYVGYIRTPIRKIDIEPKFAEVSIEHVIRLYNYVYSYQDSSDDDLLGINYSNRSIEQIFLNRLREQLSLGLLQEYEEKSSRLDYLKGNVAYAKTYKNSKLFKKRPVETKAFELSMNLDINKLITGALTIICHSNTYSSDSIELLEYFRGVTPCIENASDFLAQIVFTSKTNRYKRIASDAAMIIDSLYYDDTKGSTGGESFLINFDLLFELFVRKILLVETEEHDFSVWASPKTYAEEYFGKEMIGKRDYLPDILYKFNPDDPANGYVPSARAILDVKNKAYSNFKNADVYQIMLYNQLLFADCNILIYPSFVERDSTHLNILNDSISVPKVSAAFINIAKEEASEFKISIKNFIRKIYEILDA